MQNCGGSFHVAPIVAQEFNDRRYDKPLHIGAGSVMSAQRVPFPLVERTLQQRAEDGGFNVLPPGRGGQAQNFKLRAIQRQGIDGFEKSAIEMETMLAKDGGKSAGVHCAPQRFHHRLEIA